MEIIIGGRGYGKTTKCFEWLAEAKRTNSYPFWDRVLLVLDLDRAQRLRVELRQQAESRGEEDASLYYNQVYCVQEWEGAHLGRGAAPVKVMMDDAQSIIERMLYRRGHELAGVTWNANHGDNVIVLPEWEGAPREER